MSAKRGNRRKTIYDEEMRTIVQDLQYSVRQLVRSPGLALTALVSLALGDWGDDGGVQRDLCGVDQPIPVHGGGTGLFGLRLQSKAGQADWIISMGRRFRQVRQLAIVESCWPWITTP